MRLTCLIGMHDWWIRARIGACKAEEQCADCGATKLCWEPEMLAGDDVKWFGSAVVRKKAMQKSGRTGD